MCSIVRCVGAACCAAMTDKGVGNVLSIAFPRYKIFPVTFWMNFYSPLLSGGDSGSSSIICASFPYFCAHGKGEYCFRFGCSCRNSLSAFSTHPDICFFFICISFVHMGRVSTDFALDVHVGILFVLFDIYPDIAKCTFLPR